MRRVCGQGSCSEEAPLGHTLRYRSCFDSLAFRSNGTGGTLFPLGDKGFSTFFPAPGHTSPHDGRLGCSES